MAETLKSEEVKAMDLQILKPIGSAWEGEKVSFAQRLPDLNGKTIGEISNRAWESDRVFPAIREMLKKRYPDIKIVPYTEFPNGSANIVDNEKLPELVKAMGCDAVIGGAAG